MLAEHSTKTERTRRGSYPGNTLATAETEGGTASPLRLPVEHEARIRVGVKWADHLTIRPDLRNLLVPSTAELLCGERTPCTANRLDELPVRGELTPEELARIEYLPRKLPEGTARTIRSYLAEHPARLARDSRGKNVLDPALRKQIEHLPRGIATHACALGEVADRAFHEDIPR